MLLDDDDNFDELAKKYFVDELGLDPKDVDEAARNLVGAFEVLLRVYEREHPSPSLPPV